MTAKLARVSRGTAWPMRLLVDGRDVGIALRHRRVRRVDPAAIPLGAGPHVLVAVQSTKGGTPRYRSASDFWRYTAEKFGRLYRFYVGPLLVLPLLCLPWVLRDRWMRLALAGCLAVLALNLTTVVVFPHYAAPAAGFGRCLPIFRKHTEERSDLRQRPNDDGHRNGIAKGFTHPLAA